MTGLTTVGALTMAAGVVAALSLPLIAEARHADAVGDLARAPAGCDTTLAVERAGEYVVYLETVSDLPARPGTCMPTAQRREGMDARVAVRIVDAAGVELALRTATGERYDTDAAAGTAARAVELPVGEVTVSVSAAGDAVVAIGDEVADAGQWWRRAGLMAGALGVLVGLGLVLRGVASPSRHGRTP